MGEQLRKQSRLETEQTESCRRLYLLIFTTTAKLKLTSACLASVVQ